MYKKGNRKRNLGCVEFVFLGGSVSASIFSQMGKKEKDPPGPPRRGEGKKKNLSCTTTNTTIRLQTLNE